MPSTQWATRPSSQSGKLMWDKEDLVRLHARIKNRGADVPVMDICKEIADEMSSDVPSITPHKIYQRAYFYDASLPAKQRFIDTTRSRRAVQSAKTRAGMTSTATKPKARKRAKAKRAAVVATQAPVLTDPVSQLQAYVAEINQAKDQAEARAKKAEAERDRLANKLSKLHQLTA